MFSHHSKQSLNLSILMPFSAFAIFFVPPLPQWQNITLWGLFTSGEKSHLGRDQVNREVGTWGSCGFWLKTAEHSTVWAGALISHPSWNGQMRWKSSKKISLKPNAVSHNNTSWYTDTDGFLEHSPSRGSLYYKKIITIFALQKIITIFWEGALLYTPFWMQVPLISLQHPNNHL